MKDSLTPEQVLEIKKRMAELPPEQLKEMVKKQCLFCQIVSGVIKSNKIYEDNKLVVILDINPASKGHVIVVLKEHCNTLLDVPDNMIEYLFRVVNKISFEIADKLNAAGVNIFVANGEIAGQTVPHAVVHIIPRYEDDGLNFEWERKKVSASELEALTKHLKFDKSFSTEVSEEDKKEIKKNIEEDKKETKIMSLNIKKRIP